MRADSRTPILAFLFVFVSLTCVPFVEARAAEELGQFKFGSFLLEPEYRVFDVNGPNLPNAGNTGFAMRQSQLEGQWIFDPEIDGVVRVGNISQIGRVPVGGPTSQTLTDVNQYGLVEAYAQYHSPFGDLRAGLLQANFSLEGTLNEGALFFERSLVWRERRVPLRDFGVQFFTTHNDFYTSATIRNGEADVDQDGRQFFTSTFGWMGPMGVHVGLSGNVGRVVRQNVEFRERDAAVFGSFGGFNTNLQIELMTGESKSDFQNTQFLTYHIDAAEPFSDNWGLQARFDWLNRDNRATNQIVQEIDGGFYFQNGTGTSTVYILGRYTVDQQLITNDWAGFIIWRLMSTTRLARDEFSDRVRSAL